MFGCCCCCCCSFDGDVLGWRCLLFVFTAAALVQFDAMLKMLCLVAVFDIAVACLFDAPLVFAVGLLVVWFVSWFVCLLAGCFVGPVVCWFGY